MSISNGTTVVPVTTPKTEDVNPQIALIVSQIEVSARNGDMKALKELTKKLQQLRKESPKSYLLIGEYNGSPMLRFYTKPDSKVTDFASLQFGVQKARWIVDHIDEIRKFAGK